MPLDDQDPNADATDLAPFGPTPFPMPFPIPFPRPLPGPIGLPLPLPLPLPFPKFPPFPQPSPNFPVFRSLRAGCWLVSFTPTGGGIVAFDGTIRVETHSAGRTASGDLYQRPVLFLPPPWGSGPVLLSPPNPANGIPILSRSRYRYYLRVTNLLENFTVGTSFQLGFEMWRFTAPNTWVNEGAVTAQMSWTPAPGGYPNSGDYLEGDVMQGGALRGRLRMGWVSARFRRAVVEIDTVANAERPLNNGAGLGWTEVFNAINWDVTVQLSDTNVAEPSGAGWSDAEMHAAMLARRSATNLDTEWRYHILSVRTIDSTDRGIMFDAFATDSNNVPREGVGIATQWMIPNTPEWGLVRGQRFGAAAAPFFRTAVHELGHAMGLFHNTIDNGFMNTTNVIAGNATPANPFPNNIQWSFSPDDLERLRHYPDVFVRPGGSAFGTASSATPMISPTDLEVTPPGLAFSATAMLGEVPIGAPVRVVMELRNDGPVPQLVPERLSLKTEFLHGTVRDPAGTARRFTPLVLCIEDQPMRTLAPGEAIRGAMTLLRGGDGALFPSPGLHAIEVALHWESGPVTLHLHADTSVLVTGIVDAAHAAAAHRMLATPDTLPQLVVGGEHLADGLAAIQEAVADSVLRPHYAAIEAKRLAKRGTGRKPDLQRAAAMLDAGAVVSPAESHRLSALADASGGQGAKALNAKLAGRGGKPAA